MRKIIITLVLSLLLSGFTKSESNIKLNAIRSIQITPSASNLDFGEVTVEYGEVECQTSILLTITTHEPLNIRVRSPRVIQLNNHDRGTVKFNSILKGDQGIITEDSSSLYWESVAPSPSSLYEVEFSGSFVLNGDENTGTYQGQVNLVVDYN